MFPFACCVARDLKQCRNVYWTWAKSPRCSDLLPLHPKNRSLRRSESVGLLFSLCPVQGHTLTKLLTACDCATAQISLGGHIQHVQHSLLRKVGLQQASCVAHKGRMFLRTGRGLSQKSCRVTNSFFAGVMRKGAVNCLTLTERIDFLSV